MQTNKQKNRKTLILLVYKVINTQTTFFFNIKDETFCEHCKNGYRMAVAHFTLISY